MNNFLQDHLNKLKIKFSNPELELRILLNKNSKNKKQIILSNFHIRDIDISKFIKAFERRIKMEPISKIYNSKFFWKYNFFVDQNVLDPRPETELIVEKVLQYYPNKNSHLKILDLCTGSGCLAIVLSKEYLNSKITATDISSKALKIAKINSFKLNCENKIKFIKCDILKQIKQYDIVVSNPPYLSEAEYYKTSSEIKLYEPKIALLALKDGYEYYEKIAKILPFILNKRSKAFLEIGFSQALEAIKIFESKNLKCLNVVKDLQNLNRVLILNKS